MLSKQVIQDRAVKRSRPGARRQYGVVETKMEQLREVAESRRDARREAPIRGGETLREAPTRGWSKPWLAFNFGANTGFDSRPTQRGP